MENEVNEAYLPYLTALSRKLAFVREKEGQNMPAVEQLVPEVERLRLKVRARGFHFRSRCCISHAEHTTCVVAWVGAGRGEGARVPA